MARRSRTLILAALALAGAAGRVPAQNAQAADAAPRLMVVEDFTIFT